MEYDAVIIGSGIAGAGLAYNLRGSGLKVLVLDNKNSSSDETYRVRNTFPEIVEKYRLPVQKKMKGIKIGSYQDIYLKLEMPMYLLDYEDCCNDLLSRSGAVFKKEKAIDLRSNHLLTDKGKYRYKNLIDCSGKGFFLRKKLNLNLPFRFWLGDLRVYENSESIEEDYFYYMFGDKGFFEDLYFHNNKIICGRWQYTADLNFNNIEKTRRTLADMYTDQKHITQTGAIIPCTPAFPIVIKKRNIAFLGDSFGNASTASAEGIRFILDSSEILAKAIRLGDLGIYEKLWKKTYFRIYMVHLASRLDRYTSHWLKKLIPYPQNQDIIRLFSKYPSAMKSFIKTSRKIKLPKEVSSKYPVYQKISLLLNYLKLQLKYGIQNM